MSWVTPQFSECNACLGFNHQPGNLWEKNTHHTCRPQRHLLVAPGCNSQYEREEENGADNGPDDDVCTGDTWDRGREEEGRGGQVCVNWMSLVSWVMWTHGDSQTTKHCSRTQEHTTFSRKSVKGERGGINWEQRNCCHPSALVWGELSSAVGSHSEIRLVNFSFFVF